KGSEYGPMGGLIGGVMGGAMGSNIGRTATAARGAVQDAALGAGKGAIGDVFLPTGVPVLTIGGTTVGGYRGMRQAWHQSNMPQGYGQPVAGAQNLDDATTFVQDALRGDRLQIENGIQSAIKA